MNAPRVLILAHGHPDFSLGGGEVAAHAQWRELRRRGIEAMLLARVVPGVAPPGAWFANRSSDGYEMLFAAPPTHYFRHSQPNRGVVYHQFRELLERFQPDVVHFHHYVHMGLELVREVRKFSQHTRIVMTLHEFLAMCNAEGQMRKTNGLLCTRSTPLDCNQCFPDISRQEFFMRELFIKSFLGLVDQFVCPSAFLRDRYVEWGLPAERMLVLENGQPAGLMPAATGTPSAGTSAAADRLRVSFVALGQLSRLKGTLVLLDAIALLPPRIRRQISVEIHGSSRYESEPFHTAFDTAAKALQKTVRTFGPYRHEELGGIIQRHGWVIQPSLWWENSPLVIQEAFAFGRPVICSNIGGMAQKVTHGVDGLHFRVGSPGDLAATIERCVTEPTLWSQLCAGVKQPPTIADTVDELLAVYGREPKRMERALDQSKLRV